ncbi:MAG TPA: DUF3054 domain-containing protein [Acidimicrobiales bacterium]|nr:DUF3054 domain-containing protein [Acidimicrobiales bacterium]
MRYFRVLADVLVILVFVAIGRNTHDHGVSATGLASTMWPFVAGLIIAWSVMIFRHRSGSSLSEGLVIAVMTVAVGMVVRVLAGQGTALAFIVVALLFLSALMGGWRLAMLKLHRR